MIKKISALIYAYSKDKFIRFADWMKTRCYGNKTKKMSIIAFTLTSVVAFKLSVIFLTHYNNVYEFKIERLDADSMEMVCGFRNATCPMSLKVTNMSVEMYCQDTQEKNEAVVFNIEDFYFEKAETMMQQIQLDVTRMNNLLLFDIMTKRKPDVVVVVKASIHPRFGGIRFLGISVERCIQYSFKSENHKDIPLFKDLQMHEKEADISEIDLTFNSGYFSFPVWFNAKIKASTFYFKKPRMAVSIENFEIVDGIMCQNIKSVIKAKNTQKVISILTTNENSRSVRFEMQKYSGDNTFLQKMCKNLIMRFHLGEGAVNTQKDKKARYHFKVLGYNNNILSVNFEMIDNVLKKLIKVHSFLGKELRFVGYHNNISPILEISANIHYEEKMSAQLQIKIIDMTRFIEFIYFKKSFVSIKLNKKTFPGFVLFTTALILDANGLCKFLPDMSKFDYETEKKQMKHEKELKEKKCKGKNVAYEYYHSLTIDCQEFNINSSLNFGTNKSEDSRIIIEFDDDIVISANAEKLKALLTIEKDSWIKIKNQETFTVDGKTYETPFIDLFTGVIITQLKVIPLGVHECQALRSYALQFGNWTESDAGAGLSDAYKYLFFVSNKKIEIENTVVDLEYLIRRWETEYISKPPKQPENVKIIHLNDFRLNQNKIEINIGTDEVLVKDDASNNENATNNEYTEYTNSHGQIILIPKMKNQNHIIRHTFTIENAMCIKVYDSNLGYINVEPCEIKFIKSENGLHNISCSKKLEFTFSKNINLLKLLYYVKNAQIGDIFSCNDGFAFTRFINDILILHSTNRSTPMMDYGFKGEAATNVNLTMDRDFVVLKYSLKFCDIIKSELKAVYKSVSLEIAPFKLILCNNNGYLDFAGMNIYYDNVTKKTCISDIQISLKFSMLAVTNLTNFPVVKQNDYEIDDAFRNMPSQYSQILFTGCISKAFRHHFIPKRSVKFICKEVEVLVDDIDIKEEERHVNFNVKGRILIQSIHGLMLAQERKFNDLFKFRPAKFVNTLDISNIPLFTIICDDKAISNIYCDKMVAYQTIDLQCRNMEYLNYTLALTKSNRYALLTKEISFKKSDFIEFVKPNTVPGDPTITLYPGFYDTTDLFLLRIPFEIKFNKPLHIVYTNIDKSSIVIKIALSPKNNETWLLGKVINNPENLFFIQRFLRYFQFNRSKLRHLHIFIDKKIAHSMVLLDPKLKDFNGFFAWLLLRLVRNFGSSVMYNLCRINSNLINQCPYNVDDFKDEVDDLDKIFAECCMINN